MLTLDEIDVYKKKMNKFCEYIKIQLLKQISRMGNIRIYALILIFMNYFAFHQNLKLKNLSFEHRWVDLKINDVFTLTIIACGAWVRDTRQFIDSVGSPNQHNKTTNLYLSLPSCFLLRLNSSATHSPNHYWCFSFSFFLLRKIGI